MRHKMNSTFKKIAKVQKKKNLPIPSAVPWLYAWYRTFSSLRIEWGSISSEEANGILLGYTVYYRVYNSNESFTNISVNHRRVTITGLKMATGYEIKVAGRTSVGEGAERSTYAETECGQNFDRPSGEFSFNGGSKLFHYRYCSWTIRSPVVNSSILLLFEEHRQDYYWYTSYIRSARQEKRLVRNRKVPFAVLVLDSLVTIRTYGYEKYTRLKVHYLIVNNSRSDALYQRGWNVTISNVSSSTIGASWPALSTASSNPTYIYGYVLFLRMLLTGIGDIYMQEIANSTSLSAVVSGLRAYVKYQVEAVAILKDCVSGKISLKTSESAQIQTEKGAPFRAPSVIRILALDNQSIFVNWYALPQVDSGGFLRGYIVYYEDSWTRQTKNVTVGPQQRQVILTDLEPGTYYRIYVSAFTAMGEGPRNYYGIRTRCEMLISGHIGEISSPGFPHYIDWGECTWDYTAPDNNSVLLLTFQHFDLPFTLNCRRFYVEINKGQDVERICGRRDGLTAVWEGPSLRVRYYSRRRTSLATGFKAQYHTLNGSLTEAPRIQGWNVTAESTSSTTVLVTWPNDTLALSMKGIYGFIAACTATESKDTLRFAAVNSSSFRALVQRLLPYTKYRVQVIALSKSQSNGSVSMRSSSAVILRTKEDVPSKPPSNISAYGTNSTTIRVTWSPIDKHDIRGELQGYLVQYKEAWTQESYHSMSVGPLVSSVLLKGLKVFTLYRIHLSGFTRAGVGVQSRPHFPKTGCLFFVLSNVRDFTSPNYPSNYPSNANCTWVIGQGMELKETKIILFFDYFHTEGFGSPCSSDYVQVRDKSQSIDWKFCGKRSPFAVTFTESSFTVRLYSDNGIEEKGFYARYLLVKQKTDLDITKKQENTISASAILEWKKTQNVGELKGYIVLYKLSQPSTYWNVIRTNGTQVSLENIQPRKEYTVRVLLLAKSNVTYISQTVTLETGVVQTTEEPINTPSPTAEVPMQLMYPYGPSAGDSEIPNTLEYSRQCFKIDIPDDGMQFFGKRHYKVYGFSKVYYHVYSDSDPSSTPMLKRASSDTEKLLSTPLPTAFKASWVLVVTWKNLRPYQYPANMANQGNTFQLVLITNGVYSFTMFNYPSTSLQWSAPTQRMYYQYFSNSRGLPVVGWNAGDKGERKYNLPRSGTVNIETIDGIRGNADMVGKWFFRLEESLGRLSARQECIDWFKAQPDPRFYTEYLEPCPCILRQARGDERFTVNWRGWTRMCAYSQFPSPDGWGQECCYSTNWQSRGALLVGNPGGGSAHRYHKLTEELRAKHDASDVQGYQKCCVNSDLCDLYYRRRPSDDCRDYVAPEWSWICCDPHFVTLDGKNYTFNGLGEYIMADARDGFFQLQARTKLAKGDGTATVFSAAAAKEGNSSIVQVELNDAGIGVLIDGESFDYISLSNESVILNGSVAVAKPDNNSFLMVFPSGISVTAKAVSGALSLVLAAPNSFKNQTKGLLGTWNDDPEDDFLTPNGTILPSSANGKNIHYNFGLLWQVDNKSTLFTYKPGESLKTFENISFVPMFLEDISFPNDTLRKQAEEACQGNLNCLFDSASTKDVTMGASTKALSSTLEKESSSLKNYPPRFVTQLSQVNVTVNQSTSVTVFAEDPNNDTLVFSIFGVLPHAAILQNTSNSMSVKWNGTNEQYSSWYSDWLRLCPSYAKRRTYYPLRPPCFQIALEFVVTDDRGATAFLRPIINLCACHNDGVCLQSASNKNSTYGSNKMNVLQCRCLNGYTGKFCESDLDACEANLNPCYPGVTCIDLPPPANISGYKCGPCPNGFTGDGSKCRDFDECSQGSNGGCSQVCINTPGSFTCDCRKGYLLNIDQKKCDDVNECIPVSDCMHKCENTNGGYRCSCDNFFKVDPSNPKNCLPDSPCQKGKHSCQHICYYGSNKIQQCACRRGYLLGGDGNACKDIDECATNEDRCSHDCSNTEGSYTCSCMDGFRLDGDNVTCIGLDKNQKPPPPPPAPTPRIPSLIEKRQAIIIAFKGLNLPQWTLPVEQVFKGAVADSVTTFCGESRDCITRRLRKRRALDYVLFTPDQVHLLPGYPESTTDLFQIRVAIYVQFPPGVATDSPSALDKNILLTVIETSREQLEKALNVTVVSLTIAFLDSSTESSSTETPKVNREEIPKLYFIIGGATAGVILIIILCVLGCRRNCNSKQVQKGTTVAYNEDDDVELHRFQGHFGNHREDENCYTNEQALDTDNEAI
ncbi:Mucin-4 [Stylophora pistillata]|uniref:Mucin-4 n=1 Tax=Stylophora pistillata TaxID=50429 RepID=A0A2B4STC4_STYPI|nr:Mucin-4 [Stylophora pistillata]